MSIKYMSMDEFRALGVLQEINRQFLHPLGLALEANMESNTLRVWDERADLDGIVFADLDAEKAKRFAAFRRLRHGQRMARLAFVEQPIEEGGMSELEKVKQDAVERALKERDAARKELFLAEYKALCERHKLFFGVYGGGEIVVYDERNEDAMHRIENGEATT